MGKTSCGEIDDTRTHLNMYCKIMRDLSQDFMFNFCRKS